MHQAVGSINLRESIAIGLSKRAQCKYMYTEAISSLSSADAHTQFKDHVTARDYTLPKGIARTILKNLIELQKT